MLTPLDDSLWHQIATTFDHVGTSDPRFFDRYWFACSNPEDGTTFQMTMGVYRNMNVADGGATLVYQGKQYNLRVSRSLNRDATAVVGPLSVTPTVPLQELVIQIAPGQHPIHGEITWSGITPAQQEFPHFKRDRGRVVQEYQRFCQIGTASGWIDLEGKQIEIRDWWACRDHSWGVRQGIAIKEPMTGAKVALADKGHVHAFLYLSTSRYSGSVQMQRRGDDPYVPTGVVVDRDSGEAHELLALELEVDLVEGTRRFDQARLLARFESGLVLKLSAQAFAASVVMRGLGYSGGYDDRLGVGVWRGESYQEQDIWDVSHPEAVVDAQGKTSTPWHRIQPVTLTCEELAPEGGRATLCSTGMGSFTLTISGALPAYLVNATAPTSQG